MSIENKNKGYVYVLTNPSMPGIVKIGRSIHGGQGRADALYKNDTGVPTPFVLEFEMMFDDCVEAEKTIHRCYSEKRINPGREFFSVAVDQAVVLLLELAAFYRGREVINPSLVGTFRLDTGYGKKGFSAYLPDTFCKGKDQSSLADVVSSFASHHKDLLQEAYDQHVESEKEWLKSVRNKANLSVVSK